MKKLVALLCLLVSILSFPLAFAMNVSLDSHGSYISPNRTFMINIPPDVKIFDVSAKTPPVKKYEYIDMGSKNPGGDPRYGDLHSVEWYFQSYANSGATKNQEFQVLKNYAMRDFNLRDINVSKTSFKVMNGHPTYTVQGIASDSYNSNIPILITRIDFPHNTGVVFSKFSKAPGFQSPSDQYKLFLSDHNHLVITLKKL